MATFKFKVVILCLCLTVIAGCKSPVISQKTESVNLDEFSEVVEDVEVKMYQDIVADYNELTLDEMEEMLLQSDGTQLYYFYFGRATCLYCRKFVIENTDLIEDTENFYYINTENLTEDQNESLNEYGIEVVPSILSATDSKDIQLVGIDEFVDSKVQK